MLIIIETIIKVSFMRQIALKHVSVDILKVNMF